MMTNHITLIINVARGHAPLPAGPDSPALAALALALALALARRALARRAALTATSAATDGDDGRHNQTVLQGCAGVFGRRR